MRTSPSAKARQFRSREGICAGCSRPRKHMTAGLCHRCEKSRRAALPIAGVGSSGGPTSATGSAATGGGAKAAEAALSGAFAEATRT